MLIATRIRLYPDADQEAFLTAQFGAVRFVWNRALAAKRHYWRVKRKSLSPRMDLKPILKIAKRSRRYAWLKDFDSMALQQSLLNLEKAYTAFFERRARFPRFKSRHGEQSSHHCTGAIGVVENGITLPKVKRPIRAVVHRAIEGKVKSITVSRDRSGRWFAAVLVEDGKAIPEKRIVRPRQVLGLDVGLIDLVVTSHGTKVANPRHLQRAIAALKRRQRELSRKKKGSNNQAKARLKLARAHQRLADTRKDFQHKVSRAVVRESQGAVAVESLSVRNMLKNRRLARSISDAGWSGLIEKIAYKCEREGLHLVRIDRFEPTSKTCSCCGEKRVDLGLSVRAWTCTGCGRAHDRDINAARNISAAGARKLLACGMLVSDSGGLRKTVVRTAAAGEGRKLVA